VPLAASKGGQTLAAGQVKQGAEANTQLRIEPGALVCRTSNIQGDVTIMSGTVVHPKASILAEGGPIIIGPNNIIEEFVLIRNEWLIDETAEKGKNLRERPPMFIGSHNHFEVCAEITSCKIGDYNRFEPRSRVPSGLSVGNYSVVGAGASIRERPPDYSVVFGPLAAVTRVLGFDLTDVHEQHMTHLQLLRETLPLHNHVIHSSSSSSSVSSATQTTTHTNALPSV
jgi:dynactin 6